jgi:hypothetical protein
MNAVRVVGIWTLRRVGGGVVGARVVRKCLRSRGLR